MIEFQNMILIQRPIEDVFAFVAEFENIPKWNYYVTDVRQTSAGPVDVGTHYHQVRKSDEQDYTITEFDAPRSVVVRTTPGSTPRFERRMVFEPVKEGTRIIDDWELDTGRGWLVERLGVGRVRGAVAENLGKLKELLETGQTRLQDGRVVRIDDKEL